MIKNMYDFNLTFKLLRNLVFATNSDFLIPTSLQPNVIDLDILNFLIFEIQNSNKTM